MHDRLHELTSRIDRLERENARLKRWGGLACAGLALLGLAAAAPAVCDVISGERLVLRDGSGRQRLTLDAYRNEAPELTLQSRDGKPLARAGIDAQGEAYLALYDAKGAPKATFTSAGAGAGAAPRTGEPAREPAKPSCEPPAKDPATVVGAR